MSVDGFIRLNEEIQIAITDVALVLSYQGLELA